MSSESASVEIPATYHAVQMPAKKGEWEYVEREMVSPGEGQVLLKVLACGLCHSDVFVKYGGMPGATFPRVPGHEVIGEVVQLGGGDLQDIKVGDRVGCGWHGGSCMTCDRCRRGNHLQCGQATVNGIYMDGGWAEYMVANACACSRVPDGLDAVEAAPLLCAGLTVFSSIRQTRALYGHPGALVAVSGLGGLGHLAVMYAAKMGYEVVAISGSESKRELAAELGAHHYINMSTQDAAAELQKLGGASLIVATAPSSEVMTKLVAGLGVDGTMQVMAVDGKPVEVMPMSIIPTRASIRGVSSGAAVDAEDTLRFSKLHNTMPMVEKFKLSDAAAAYEYMLSNKARFRVVLVPDALFEE